MIAFIIACGVSSSNFSHLESLAPDADAGTVAHSYVTACVDIFGAGFHFLIDIDPAISINSRRGSDCCVRTHACGDNNQLAGNFCAVCQIYPAFRDLVNFRVGNNLDSGVFRSFSEDL